MTKNKRRKIIPGMDDVVRVFEYLEKRKKRERREAYLAIARKLKEEKGGETVDNKEL